jgi:hypothetical protein
MRSLRLAALVLAVTAGGAVAQCDRPTSCAAVTQPPGTCVSDLGCPEPYTCVAGTCRAGECVVKADCPADGQCMHQGSAATGTCICRGCGQWDCTLGCSLGGIFTGCRCGVEEDCPPEDDVCFRGLCS